MIYAAGATAFNVWNIKGYFDTIPLDLAEAAMIDGATPTQAFLLVMLPLVRPVLAVTALFGFLAGFSDFILANTVLFDERLYTAPVGVFGLQDGYRNPWGWFAACALIIRAAGHGPVSLPPAPPGLGLVRRRGQRVTGG